MKSRNNGIDVLLDCVDLDFVLNGQKIVYNINKKKKKKFNHIALESDYDILVNMDKSNKKSFSKKIKRD